MNLIGYVAYLFLLLLPYSLRVIWDVSQHGSKSTHYAWCGDCHLRLGSIWRQRWGRCGSVRWTHMLTRGFIVVSSWSLQRRAYSGARSIARYRDNIWAPLSFLYVFRRCDVYRHTFSCAPRPKISAIRASALLLLRYHKRAEGEVSEWNSNLVLRSPYPFHHVKSGRNRCGVAKDAPTDHRARIAERLLPGRYPPRGHIGDRFPDLDEEPTKRYAVIAGSNPKAIVTVEDHPVPMVHKVLSLVRPRRCARTDNHDKAAIFLSVTVDTSHSTSYEAAPLTPSPPPIRRCRLQFQRCDR